MIPQEFLIHVGAQGFPAVDVRTRCCQYCGGEPAVIFDLDGCWDTEECQRYDRSSETTWWRRWER